MHTEHRGGVGEEASTFPVMDGCQSQPGFRSTKKAPISQAVQMLLKKTREDSWSKSACHTSFQVPWCCWPKGNVTFCHIRDEATEIPGWEKPTSGYFWKIHSTALQMASDQRTVLCPEETTGQQRKTIEWKVRQDQDVMQ